MKPILLADLQKAFDTVKHDILLLKLEHFDVRGVKNEWFKSYLSNREQYPSINGYDSNLAAAKFGAALGTVLNFALNQ